MFEILRIVINFVAKNDDQNVNFKLLQSKTNRGLEL